MFYYKFKDSTGEQFFRSSNPISIGCSDDSEAELFESRRACEIDFDRLDMKVDGLYFGECIEVKKDDLLSVKHNIITSATTGMCSAIYLIDNIRAMKLYPSNHFDIAVVDPPYGLGDRLSDGGGKFKDTPMAELYKDKEWDILPTAEYWKQLFRVSKNQIVFGANYFLDHLPPTRGIVCWDKKQAMPTLSAWEMVWTSYDKPAKIYAKSSNDLDRFHPTQKPVGIYDFVFQFAKSEPGMNILDTNLGSGNSRISADKNKLNFTGFEIDEVYFDKSIDNFSAFDSTLRLNF